MTGSRGKMFSGTTITAETAENAHKTDPWVQRLLRGAPLEPSIASSSAWRVAENGLATVTPLQVKPS